MCKYQMVPASIVEGTERTLFCPQTDGQTDGRPEDGWHETSIPPFNFVEGGIIKHEECAYFLECILRNVSHIKQDMPMIMITSIA